MAEKYFPDVCLNETGAVAEKLDQAGDDTDRADLQTSSADDAGYPDT